VGDFAASAVRLGVSDGSGAYANATTTFAVTVGSPPSS
jgi:hypothetical protein